MSFDLGVWYPHENLSNKKAGERYAYLCESQIDEAKPHPAVDAFYGELTAKHPEIDTIPEDRADDHDYCPWSCALDRSPGHVIIPCVWSKAEYVYDFVHSLAAKHGLAVYDPQSDRITYPPDHLFAIKQDSISQVPIEELRASRWPAVFCFAGAILLAALAFLAYWIEGFKWFELAGFAMSLVCMLGVVDALSGGRALRRPNSRRS